MVPKLSKIVKAVTMPLVLCFAMLSVAVLCSFLFGNFVGKIKYVSLLGVIADVWTVVFFLQLVNSVFGIFLCKKNGFCKSVWGSFASLLLFPGGIFSLVFFMYHTSNKGLLELRDNVREHFPIRQLYYNLDRKSVENPVTFSSFNVFIKTEKEDKVLGVLKEMDLFVKELEKYYQVNLDKPVYIVVTEHPYFDARHTMASLYGRNVIVITKENFLAKEGLYPLKHEVVHIFNKIYAETNQIVFPRFHDELVSQRLRYLKQGATPCFVQGKYQKIIEPIIYKKMLPEIFEKLRKHYSTDEIFKMPKYNERSKYLYGFLDVVSCNLNVPLYRYLDWVKNSNEMSVKEAFKKTFGVEFIEFVARPKRIQKAAGEAWLLNKLKVLENEN